MIEKPSTLNLAAKADGQPERQSPRKVLDICIREPSLGNRQCRSAEVDNHLNGTGCNIACEVGSWGLSQSYFDKHTQMVNKKELLRSILESTIESKSYSHSFNPIEYHLKQIEWAVFGTITFKEDYMTWDNKISEEKRLRVFHRLIGITCSKLKIKNRRLIYYQKIEWGSGHRGHINFLIGMDGIEPVTPLELSKRMAAYWAGGLYPIGTAVIEPFRKDLHDEGISYQTKLEFDSCGNQLNNSEEFSDMLLKRMQRNSLNEIELSFTE